MNNCSSIIFKGECEKLEESLAKHEKQMSLSLAIMSRNPIITARAVIIHDAELLYSLLKIILNVLNNNSHLYNKWHFCGPSLLKCALHFN